MRENLKKSKSTKKLRGNLYGFKVPFAVRNLTAVGRPGIPFINRSGMKPKQGFFSKPEIIISKDGSYTIQITMTAGAVAAHSRDSALLVAQKRLLQERADEVRSEISQVEEKQVSLYKQTVLERVADRFKTAEAAEEWFEHGHIPGYSEKTPREMVEQGKTARIIEAINAIEAGVYA